jgi:hypothetical protein
MKYGLANDNPSENSSKGDSLFMITRALFSICAIALFSTCVIAQTANSPSSAESQKADPAAWNMLKSARETSQTIPANFAGVTVDVVVNDNGKVVKGSINYEAGKSLDLKVEGMDEEAKGWLNDQTMSIIAHRRGGDFSKGDGHHPITFAEDDNSPAGRRIAINDQMKSHYRVRDNKVVEVDRVMGADHFIISVLDTVKTPEGKNLPRHFTVTYFDAKSGAVKRTETFTDEYKLTDGVWFPVSRLMRRAENGKVITRVIEFHNPRIRFNNEQAAR